jgi:hypothetical protein
MLMEELELSVVNNLKENDTDYTMNEVRKQMIKNMEIHHIKRQPSLDILLTFYIKI